MSMIIAVFAPCSQSERQASAGQCSQAASLKLGDTYKLIWSKAAALTVCAAT